MELLEKLQKAFGKVGLNEETQVALTVEELSRLIALEIGNIHYIKTLENNLMKALTK